mgnify:FL=1
MAFRVRFLAFSAAVAAGLFVFSCAKKEKEPETAGAGSAPVDSAIEFVKEDVSFGAFFDAEGTKRTAEIKGGKEAKLYIIVSFPETMQIAAVEYRLVLPEGVAIQSDKSYDKRIAFIGTYDEGVSEIFPCVPGPKIALHELVLLVPPGIKNGEIALMPSIKGENLAVALCEEGNPLIAASSYKAVINPAD